MLELEARAEPSRLMAWASPLLAVALMLVGGLAVFAALGKDPVEGFRVFFLNPVKDLYALSESPKYSAPPVAATAPSMNWPSAPMFHTLARKPIARPIAHSISGVALSSSSESA